MDKLTVTPDTTEETVKIKEAMDACKKAYKKAPFQIRVTWIYIKTFFLLWFRFAKARIGLVIYYVNVWTGGYRFITAKEFLTLYPAAKGCKHCSYGQGFVVARRPDKQKEVVFCECVLKQYRASEKRFIVRGIE